MKKYSKNQKEKKHNNFIDRWISYLNALNQYEYSGESFVDLPDFDLKGIALDAKKENP